MPPITKASERASPLPKICSGIISSGDSVSLSDSGIHALYGGAGSGCCGGGGWGGPGGDVHGSDAAPSTSYPTCSMTDGWDALGACMTIASETEAGVDALVRGTDLECHSHSGRTQVVPSMLWAKQSTECGPCCQDFTFLPRSIIPSHQLEGSIKSAHALFVRYDMDLDGRLRQQDLYDLLLELALALPSEDYARLIDALYVAAAAAPHQGLGASEFVALYKELARIRRAFRRQDHHCNGQIDRCAQKAHARIHACSCQMRLA